MEMTRGVFGRFRSRRGSLPSGLRVVQTISVLPEVECTQTVSSWRARARATRSVASGVQRTRRNHSSSPSAYGWVRPSTRSDAVVRSRA